jgi:hypothetical protein
MGIAPEYIGKIHPNAQRVAQHCNKHERIDDEMAVCVVT